MARQKKQATRKETVKVDPWAGTRWKVRVNVAGRHVFPYLGGGTDRASALKLARTMANPAYVVKTWDPPTDPEQWPAWSRPLALRTSDDEALRTSGDESNDQ